MNTPVTAATNRHLKQIAPSPSASRKLRLRFGFYGAMSTMLSVSVLAGFSRTFYFRAAFDVPRVPGYVLVHGGILTAWFAGLVIQTLLVRAGRADLHRRLGWWVGGTGLLVATVTGPVILSLASQQTALGLTIDARIIRLVWLDLAILAAFVVFAATGILMRHRTAWHKRMMLLASISIVTPAVGRVWRLVPVLNERNALLTTNALVLCLVGLALHDVLSQRRIHPATLAGAAFLMGLRTVAVMIADSEMGRSFVRALG